MDEGSIQLFAKIWVNHFVKEFFTFRMIRTNFGEQFFKNLNSATNLRVRIICA